MLREIDGSTLGTTSTPSTGQKRTPSSYVRLQRGQLVIDLSGLARDHAGSARLRLHTKHACTIDAVGTATSAPARPPVSSPTSSAKTTTTGWILAASPMIFGLKRLASRK